MSHIQKVVNELHIWSKARHAFVLPLLGFYVDDSQLVHLVSEWMENGTLLDYMPHIGRGKPTLLMVCPLFVFLINTEAP